MTGYPEVTEGGGVVKDDPWTSTPRRAAPPRSVAVIGAGIAGCASAASLAARGITTFLLDRGDVPGAGGSGNPAAVLAPYLGGPGNTLTDFFEDAYDTALELYRAGSYVPSGVIQYPTSARLKNLFAADVDHVARWGRRLSSSPEAPLFIEKAGYLEPRKILDHLLSEKLRFIGGAEVSRIDRDDSEGCWRLRSRDGSEIVSAEAVIVAIAGELEAFEQTRWLSIERVTGQVVMVDAAPCFTDLLSPICGAVYLIPEIEGRHLVGATFRHGDDAMLPSDTETDFLTRGAEALVPGASSARVSSVRVSSRASTYDRLPFVGPVHDVPACLEILSNLRPGSTVRRELPFLPGFYVSAGFAARGFGTAPLAARIVTEYLFGEESPIFQRTSALIHPGRVLRRAWKQQRLPLRHPN